MVVNEETMSVFVKTNNDTRLALLLDKDDSVSVFKDKICKEHEQCFPSFGKITISALKVNWADQYYHLPDSMVLSQAFQAISNNALFLSADLEEKCELLAACSKPDPTLKTKLAEDKTKKRKMKTSDGSSKRSRKKPALGDGTSGKGKAEPFATGAIGKDIENGEGTLDFENKVVDDVNMTHKDGLLSKAIGKACPVSNLEASSSAGEKKSSKDHIHQSAVAEKEGEKMTNTLVLMAVQNENEMGTKDNGGKDTDEATKSVKASRKIRTKKAKAPAKEDAEEASSKPNVEPDVVMIDPQENVDKVVKKSSKKSKKDQDLNVVE